MPPNKGLEQTRRSELIKAVTVSAVFGGIAVIAPAALRPTTHYDSPLFPLVRNAIEGFHLESLVFVFFVGFFVAAGSEAPWPVVGLSTMGLFPLCSLAEAIVDPTSHNLLPIEWMGYVFMSLPGVAGAWLARRLAGDPAPPASGGVGAKASQQAPPGERERA